jgi:hypothetical protein
MAATAEPLAGAPAQRAMSRLRRRPASSPRLPRWLRVRMSDSLAVALLAAVVCIGFFVWYDAHGVTNAFNDARSRELIARRVLVSRTPGLAQFGATWLPLPFLLMLPLIWNDTLFRVGIAGSLPSMLAYVVASLYMYRIARLVTSSRAAGWVAAGVLMLNPSLLYMQSTPMSETVSLAASVVAMYYALRLTRTYHALDVVKCAAAVAAATLVRYENWVLAIALLPVLAYVAWRRRGYALLEAWMILYGLLAFAGCAGWILYNAVIFHDPLLSFYYGQSSHTFYANTPDYLLPARHHAWLAFAVYGLTVAKTVGWPILAMSVLGLGVFIWRGRLRPPALPAYLTLVPFGFYWLALYRGANTEGLPELGMGPYYNIRFGLAMIPAVALFSAFLCMVVPMRLRRALLGAQLTVVGFLSVVGLTHGTPFVLREAVSGYGGDTRQTGPREARWFASHYRCGSVLYTYVNDPALMFYLLTQDHISDYAFITDANGPQFTDALQHPERTVSWIIMSSDTNNAEDRLSATLHHRQDWRHYFVLRRTFAAHHSISGSYGTTQVYQRIPGRSGPSRCT